MDTENDGPWKMTENVCSFQNWLFGVQSGPRH